MFHLSSPHHLIPPTPSKNTPTPQTNNSMKFIPTCVPSVIKAQFSNQKMVIYLFPPPTDKFNKEIIIVIGFIEL
jgi:hypothetical protein